MKYFDSEEFSTNTSFWFEANGTHSTQTVLSILVDTLYQLILCKKHIIGVYIDLRETINLVNYDIAYINNINTNHGQRHWVYHKVAYWYHCCLYPMHQRY